MEDRADFASTAASFFFRNTPRHAPDAPVLICPLLDEKGHRQGVFAQLLHDAPPHYSLDNELLGNGSSHSSSKSSSRTSQNCHNLSRPEQDQDTELDNISHSSDDPGATVKAISAHEQLDSKQSQLFQRFAELLPTGLAILDHNVGILSPAA